jgi:hypothetical protein
MPPFLSNGLQRLWTQIHPSGWGQTCMRDKNWADFPLSVLAYLTLVGGSPSAEVNFALPIGFWACVWFVVAIISNNHSTHNHRLWGYRTTAVIGDW